MQNGEEDGALGVEAEAARGQRLAHHVVAAGQAPETLEDQCGAEGAGVGAGVVGRGQGGQDG